MKKKTILISAVILIIVFSGCGSSNEDAFIGTWKLDCYFGSQGEFRASELQSLGLSGTIEIRADHSATISLMGRTAEVKWELKGSETIIFSNPDNSEAAVEMNLKDGSLTVEDAISKMTFIK